MNTKTMIAAVAAVVIIIAAAGAVVLTQNPASDDSNDAVLATYLNIYGNANDDLTIDSKDLEIINDIIDGTKSQEDYPLADADRNGTIDENDVKLVKDIIDRKEGIRINVACLDRDGSTTTVEVTYPMRNVVPHGVNIQMAALYANGGDYVAGYFKSTYKLAESSISDTAEDLKGDNRQITEAAWTNFTHLDATISGGVGALIADYSGIGQITDARAKDLADANIPLIIYAPADVKTELSTVLTLGFLFGGDCETVAYDYAMESLEVIDYIADAVKDIADEDKASYISCTMHICICQNGSSFNINGEYAGGIPYHKVNSGFASAYAGTSSVKMTSVEALSNYGDIQHIINNRSLDWSSSDLDYKSTVLDAWYHDNNGTSSTEFFKGFDDAMCYINNILPGGVRLAYMAHALYGDRFSESWADSIFQKYVDLGTAPLAGQTVRTIVTHVDKEVLERTESERIASDDSVDILNTFMNNVTGIFATGADDTAFTYVNGSKAESATISVPNGSTADGFATENTVIVKVSDDAASLFNERKAAITALVGTEALGSEYVAAKLGGRLDGISGCYLATEQGTYAYLAGYIEGVFFDCYLFTAGKITDSDLQIIADTIYNGAYDTEKYTGPAIPGESFGKDSEGAKLVAENFVTEFAEAGWSVDDDATSEAAVLTLAYKNAMGSDATLKVYIHAGEGASDIYDAGKEKVDAFDGEPVSSRNATARYGAVDAEIDGVTFAAEFGQITNNGYMYFVMKVGSIVIDASESKVFVKGSDAEPDAIALLEGFAAAIIAANEA